jgi:hypothetical protein
MRTLLMALVAVGIVALLFLGNIGPLELGIWVTLWVVWVFVLARWALPGDRRRGSSQVP